MSNDKKTKIGATGKYPQGSISEDDEGEIQIVMGINRKHKTIILHFGKQVAWLGLGADEARSIAKGLLQNADEIDKLSKENNDG